MIGEPPAGTAYVDIGKALGTDYFLLRHEIPAKELAWLDRTRRFVDDEVLPVINGFWERAELPLELIAMFGSEEHKQRWLPAMARCEKLGAFALTEPHHGSDSVALETSSRRDGDSYVLDGSKRWIGNGSIADVAVVWARDVDDHQVKGFLGAFA